jgi:hypothetical protein|tara:strand:- start:3121 stop:3276 length:156 start_codon:yes stop_codon:yes gene_type:complete
MRSDFTNGEEQAKNEKFSKSFSQSNPADFIRNLGNVKENLEKKQKKFFRKY